MGIASFSPLFVRTASLSTVLAPLQAIAAFFLPAQPASAHSRLANKPATTYRASTHPYKTHTSVATKPVRKSIVKAPVQRLKIVRQFEPGANRSCAGRLVISGRMSDVCAELDRMAG